MELTTMGGHRGPLLLLLALVVVKVVCYTNGWSRRLVQDARLGDVVAFHRCLGSHRTTTLLAATVPNFDKGRRYINQGMQAFRNHDVEDSIELFDKADQVTNRQLHPYLWQRGLSLYFADRFDEAAQQFASDVQVNPFDTEEVVWHTASLLRLDPSIVPPTNALALPPGNRGRRPIMASVYQLFRGEGSELELAAAGQTQPRSSDAFYANLYLALFCECRQEPTKAEHYLRQALATPYAHTSNDYMVAVAQVHQRVRHWTEIPPSSSDAMTAE